MSLPLFLLAFEKHTKDTPGKQAAVLVRALDCSVQLLLEVKEAWTFLLTDTILPNPAEELSLSSNPLPHLQLLLCPSTPSAEVRRSKMRGDVKVAIVIVIIKHQP